MIFPWLTALFMTQEIQRWQIHQASRRTGSAHCCPAGQWESSWECGGDDAHDERSFHRCKGVFKMTHSCFASAGRAGGQPAWSLINMCVFTAYLFKKAYVKTMFAFQCFRAEQIWSLTVMGQWNTPLRRRRWRDGASLRRMTRYETVYKLQWALLKKRSEPDDQHPDDMSN